MEHTSLQHDFCSLQQKAQVVGCLLLALQTQGQQSQPTPSTATEPYIRALRSVWAELETSMLAVGEHIDYLLDLCQQNNIPELLYVLQPQSPPQTGE